MQATQPQPPQLKTRNSPARSRLQRPIPARTLFTSCIQDLGAGALGTKLRSKARAEKEEGWRRRKRAAGRGLPRDGPQPCSG